MRWLPALSGTVAALSAALVLVSIAQPSLDRSSLSPVVDGPPTTTAAKVQAEPSPVEVRINGIDPSVSRALNDAGYTERVTPLELSGQLDPSVAQALADSGVVLLIPNTGGDR